MRPMLSANLTALDSLAARLRQWVWSVDEATATAAFLLFACWVLAAWILSCLFGED